MARRIGARLPEDAVAGENQTIICDVCAADIDAALPERVKPLGLTVEVGWIPVAAVRGNSRANRYEKARWVREYRESGFVYGGEWLRKGNAPLRSPYTLAIRAYTERSVDGDNLLIGYKAFIDGLADSGAIADDREIAEWRIAVHQKKTTAERGSYSEIEIKEAWNG